VIGMTRIHRPGGRQRANHRLLALSGLLGGAIGLGIALVATHEAPDGGHPDLLSAPLPLWFAILLALAWGVVLPVISWRWHRVVDEHEREAYRDGAVAGFYAVAIGAPVWWAFWRAGVLPPVDATAVLAAMIAVSGIVWLWRKYR
jgi:hypothetical protein